MLKASKLSELKIEKATLSTTIVDFKAIDIY